jgi:hypothetical protein
MLPTHPFIHGIDASKLADEDNQLAKAFEPLNLLDVPQRRSAQLIV